MRIGVTGLSSEIGRAIENRAVLEGYLVEGMGRRPGYRSFDATRDIDPSCIEGLDGVIHLAWDREPQSPWSVAVDHNVKASAELFAACANAGIPAVLLSSSSAGQPSKSRYGAAKLASEQAASEYGFPSLRAGLIWGGGLPPILQTLQRLATIPALLPLPSPGMALDHNHESHVVSSLLQALVSGDGSDQVRSLASPEFVTSTEILQAFRGSRGALRVPVPAALAARTARKLRDAGILSTPRLDSVALLDTTSNDLHFDPEYPEALGGEAFLSWLTAGDWPTPA